MADWTSAEINQMLQLRAIEWCNWPAYISLASVPVLFIWVKWWVVILGVFLANALWACIRHRVHSLRLANTVAMIVAPGQWVVAVVCVIVQLISRHWVTRGNFWALAFTWESSVFSWGQNRPNPKLILRRRSD